MNFHKIKIEVWVTDEEMYLLQRASFWENERRVMYGLEKEINPSKVCGAYLKLEKKLIEKHTNETIIEVSRK